MLTVDVSNRENAIQGSEHAILGNIAYRQEATQLAKEIGWSACNKTAPVEISEEEAQVLCSQKTHQSQRTK